MIIKLDAMTFSKKAKTQIAKLLPTATSFKKVSGLWVIKDATGKSLGQVDKNSTTNSENYGFMELAVPTWNEHLVTAV